MTRALPLSRVLPLSLGLALLSSPAWAGTVTTEQHLGRSVRVFVPTTPATPTPLVVMLHGCTQTPDAFADATQMDAVAEKAGFVVAYPEQSVQTVSTRCFQWYDPAHQARDAGEPQNLADGTGELIAMHGIDADHVYVAGMSAGAAMAVILGATYPDRFAAIGVIAGIEYRGASSLGEGFTVSQSGGPDPATQGALAQAAMGPRARALPVFSVQGTEDGIVNKVNGDQVVAQWLTTNTLLLGATAIAPVTSAPGNAGYAFTHSVYASTGGTGASVIERYVVEGMGHAWPGGKAGGSYSDPKGPDASALVWAFFSGRTVTDPLGVPPPVLPADGGVEDGGAPGGGSGTGGGGSSSGTTADGGAGSVAPGDGSSSGGCAVGRRARPDEAAWMVGLLVLGAIVRRQRRGNLNEI